MANKWIKENNRWTDEACDYLESLWNDTNCSATECAKELYKRFGLVFTRNAIIGKANRMKLRKRGTGGKPGQGAGKPRKRSSLSRKDAQEIKRVYRESLRPGDMGLWKRFDITKPTPNGELSIADVTGEQCRWPIGDPRHDDFHLCGAWCPLTQPYCNYHMVERVMIRERPAVVARLKRGRRIRA